MPCLPLGEPHLHGIFTSGILPNIPRAGFYIPQKKQLTLTEIKPLKCCLSLHLLAHVTVPLPCL